MPSLEVFAAFTVAGLTLLLIPGPAVMYITALGLREGRTTAVAAAGGLGVGNFVHVIAATLGLSALLASSAVAFSVVKYVGAIYLVYLGIQTLRNRHRAHGEIRVASTSSGREFRRGIIVNALNPKVAIFFLAFVPQFVDSGRGSAGVQIFMLGVWFVIMVTVTDALYGVAAGEFGDWIRSRKALQTPVQTASGVVYILLGVIAALSSAGKAQSVGAVRPR